jgi:hypothetical protein
MSSAEHATATRRLALGAVLAVLAALAGLWATDEVAVARGVLRSALARDLDRIAALAGLREEDERAVMPVTVTQEGGPTWIVEEAEAAIDADPVFTRGEPHLLRIEVIEHERAIYGIRGQLWRQGWSLRAPEPLWVTPAPWIVLASALAGAAWAGRRRRGLAGGLALAGLVAQLLLWVRPWPAGFVRPSLVGSWREGPLGHGVVALARGLPEASVAVGAGVVTLCVVLMIFDHRRSPGEGGRLVAAGLLGTGGLLAFVEASLRAGLLPWAAQPAGVVALVGAVGLWWWAWRRREPRAPETAP